MKKKILMITLILILLTVVGCLIFIKLNDKSYEIEEVTEFNYFKLYDNKKYGVIDSDGKVLIEAKYDDIEIPNPSKAVFIAYINDEVKVLNDKNEKILTDYQKVLPIQLKESSSNVPYEKSVLMYQENDKYGIIDYKGKKITKANYNSIESLLYKEGCLLVNIDNKYGIINIKGKEIIKPEYDSITADGYYDNDTKYMGAGFIVGRKSNDGMRYGYINNKGEIILNVEYNEISRITEINDKDIYLLTSKNGKVGLYKNKEQIVNHFYEEIEYNSANSLFIIKKNGKQGVLDKNAKSILKTEFTHIMISGNKINAEKDETLYLYDIEGNKINSNNETIISTDTDNYFITINEQNLFGIIDKNHNKIIDNQYQYIEYAFDNYFIVSQDGKVGVIGIDKVVKINFEYNVIQKIKNTKALQAIKLEGNVSDIYDSNLKKVVSVADAQINVESNYIKVLSNNQRKYIDFNGNILKGSEIYQNNSIFAYEKDGKWGFVDINGNVKVEPIYDMVTELNSFGFAGIKLDNKWGIIDREGKIILSPVYEIEWDEPDFINKYVKVNFGYGLYYYTTDLEK